MRPLHQAFLCLQWRLLLLAAILATGAAPAWADTVLKITIKDHKFTPTTLEAPAGESFFIEVTNAGPGAEEFESNSLRLEKIIPEGRTAKLRVGPQKAGTYEIFGEFHMSTCLGSVVVK